MNKNTINNYSKIELFTINKDRLEANLKLIEENKKLKKQNAFLMKRDNVLQNLEQWLETKTFDNRIGVFTNSAYQKVLNKIKKLEGNIEK